ncbi:hypothetical protein ACHMW5_04095 [Azospirillum melinis]|uniref:hypothetical protein n=1 Tax=Azospirillum melinis TaxID=328839 RepID=UPI0037571A13
MKSYTYDDDVLRSVGQQMAGGSPTQGEREVLMVAMDNASLLGGDGEDTRQPFYLCRVLAELEMIRDMDWDIETLAPADPRVTRNDAEAVVAAFRRTYPGTEAA